MMAGPPFTREQVEALGAKLDAIDFDDDERAILLTVFRAAAAEEPEVEAFSLSQPLSMGLSVSFGLDSVHNPRCFKPRPNCYRPKCKQGTSPL